MTVDSIFNRIYCSFVNSIQLTNSKTRRRYWMLMNLSEHCVCQGHIENVRSLTRQRFMKVNDAKCADESKEKEM